MGKRFLPGVLGTVVAFALVTGFQVAGGQPADLHCPDHQSNQKFTGSGTFTFGGVQFTVAGQTLGLTNTTGAPVKITWCAKGGQNFFNGGYTSGVRTTNLGAGASAAFTFNQGVSHLVVYSVAPGGGGGGGGGGGNGGNGGNGGGGGGGGGGGDNGGNGGGGGGGGGIVDDVNGGAGPAEAIEGVVPLTG